MLVTGAAVLGVLAAAAFLLVERYRTRHPAPTPAMMPLDVFASRQFSAVNLITFLVYAALGGVLFLLVVQVQVVAGYSPLKAGTTLLPVTLLMLGFSARSGALAQRIGPRWPMTAGTAICAVGLLLMTRIGPGASYFADVLPAVTVFAVGLTLTVAPLTATVLASADVRHAGVASGVNNAVARAAGLLAVAGLPAVVGLGAASYQLPDMFNSGFHKAAIVCAVLLLAGSVLSAMLIRSDVLRAEPGEPALHARVPDELPGRRAAAGAAPQRERPAQGAPAHRASRPG